MATKHICNKVTEIELLKQEQQNIRSMVADIHKSLVGNGRPGMLKEMNELVVIQRAHADTLKVHSKVIGSLNTKLAYYSGAIAVIVFVVTYAARYINIG